MFSSVKEIDEDAKNESDGDSHNGDDETCKFNLSENKQKVVGILALTQENLRKLDLK